LIGYMKPKIKE